MERSGSSLKRDYFWNTLGSIMNAASSVILLLVTTRVMGEYWAGIFSIAYAVGQQFQTVGAFEMRPLQSTDVEGRYSFSTYLASRVLTTLCMLFCIVGYAIFSGNAPGEMILVALIAGLKLFDVFEDVFHGAFQQNGRLDIAGRSFFFRSLATTLAFALLLAFTKDLGVTCIMTAVVSFVALTALNLPPSRLLLGSFERPDLRSVGSLIVACLPLFAGAFLALYLSNAPKFGLDGTFSKEYQTYYAAIFMPALAINLLSTFVFRPLLTRLGLRWHEGDFKGFASVIRKGLFWVLAASVLTAILGYFLGIPVLNVFFGLDLSSFRGELMVLVLGGALNAAGIVLYYGLVVMKRQRLILVGYAVSAVLTFLIAQPLIGLLGMMGAAILYTISMFSVACTFGAFFLFGLRRAFQ